MPHNLDHFTHFLNGIDLEFSVLAFPETWLKPHNEQCYRVIGVSLLVKNGIEYYIWQIGIGTYWYTDCIFTILQKLLSYIQQFFFNQVD